MRSLSTATYAAIYTLLPLTSTVARETIPLTTSIDSTVESRPPSWRSLSFHRERRLITNIYIDGFNLYYRALKDTPFRWLDLRKLAETLFPRDTIDHVCYFTARLDARPNNPGQAQRQLIYLRALATLSGFEVHYGAFRSGKEKGSDVNLGYAPLGGRLQRCVRTGGRRVQRRGFRRCDAVCAR